VITLCEKHKARVITGFVEDASNLQMLWKCRVHYIQGNFLQEPDAVLNFDFG
jgi:EAL domain-containing protein (putative c-di-GMP-specific phosphodiesterase class I)